MLFFVYIQELSLITELKYKKNIGIDYSHPLAAMRCYRIL